MAAKRALFALAVGVLMGTMAVAAYAEAPVMEAYDSSDSSVSSQPEQGLEQSYEGEIRQPVEAGAVPDRSTSSSGFGSGQAGDEPTVESGGQSFRANIDLGP